MAKDISTADELYLQIRDDWGRKNIDIRPHVYFIERNVIRRQYGLSSKSVILDKLETAIYSAGEQWEYMGIGGVDKNIPGVAAAYLLEAKDSEGVNLTVFDNKEMQSLHTKISNILKGTKVGAKAASIDRWHVFTSAAITGRDELLRDLSKDPRYTKNDVMEVTSILKRAESRAYEHITKAIKAGGRFELTVNSEFTQNYAPNKEMVAGDVYLYLLKLLD